MVIKSISALSWRVSADDEHIRHDDGHAGGAAQEPQHQDVARPHGSLGPHFQYRYQSTSTDSDAPPPPHPRCSVLHPVYLSTKQSELTSS